MSGSSQNTLLWVLVLVVGVFIVWWLLTSSCNSESYSPYRDTGGCPICSGKTYLDAYYQSDYYRKYPYIYPTPTNYVRALYKGVRAEEKFRERQMRELAEDYIREKKDLMYTLV